MPCSMRVLSPPTPTGRRSGHRPTAPPSSGLPLVARLPDYVGHWSASLSGLQEPAATEAPCAIVPPLSLYSWLVAVSRPTQRHVPRNDLTISSPAQPVHPPNEVFWDLRRIILSGE